jgi:hypothetical protein
MRLDSSGNVGIGVTPDTFGSGYTALQINGYAYNIAHSGGDHYITNNAYNNSGWKYGQTSTAQKIQLASGKISLMTAASGSADSAITWNTGLTQDSAGKVGIGTTSDLGKLSVSNSATDEVVAGIQASSSSYANTILKVQCPRVTNDAYNMIKADMTGHSTRFVVTDNGDVENVNNSYNGISDQRLKTNIADASSQWDDIKALKVRKFKMGMQPDDGFKIGVISQELEASGMNGLVKESDADEYQIAYNSDLDGQKVKRVKYSILYMKAIKALQEAMTRIETLEAKVKTLEDA